MCDLKNASLAVVLFLTTFAMTSFADVKLTDTDTETLGNWVGVYGKNGAVVFIAEGKGVQHGGVAADEVIKGDIKRWDTGVGIRWCWENPADEAAESALLSIKEPNKRISGCAYHSVDWTLTLEVDLAEYYVAGYFLSGEVGGGGSARSQQIWAYQGDEKPDKPIEVRNFHHVSKGGQPRYYVWRVTGTKPFHIDFHTLVVNATISGIFIDSVRKSVESAGKLTATWASIKK